MRNKLISIIIPTFNEEDSIEECLKSIIRQEMRREIEVLIVDDDSTDNTLKIARKYQKNLSLRIIRNGTKNPERGKKIGLDACRGKFFMYLDADMSYANKNWFNVSLKPLLEDKNIIGTLASFGVNKKHNPLTRCISYDVFQRDPIFVALSMDIHDTIIENKEGYSVCLFKPDKIPTQSLCLYRAEVIKKLFKNEEMLMDNDVVSILVKKGYNLFAFCPQVRIYHFLLRNLKELYKKRMRGALKTYMAYLPKREYKWFNFSKKRNIIAMALWIMYANSVIPATIYGVYKSFKNKDLACLYEPLIALVSTDSLIYAFLKSNKGFSTLFKL